MKIGSVLLARLHLSSHTNLRCCKISICKMNLDVLECLLLLFRSWLFPVGIRPWMFVCYVNCSSWNSASWWVYHLWGHWACYSWFFTRGTLGFLASSSIVGGSIAFLDYDSSLLDLLLWIRNVASCAIHCSVFCIVLSMGLINWINDDVDGQTVVE